MNQALYRHPYSPRTLILHKISTFRRNNHRRRSPTSRSIVEKDSRRIAEESEEAEEEQKKYAKSLYTPDVDAGGHRRENLVYAKTKPPRHDRGKHT